MIQFVSINNRHDMYYFVALSSKNNSKKLYIYSPFKQSHFSLMEPKAQFISDKEFGDLVDHTR